MGYIQMPSSRTTRGGMDIDEARKERDKLRLKIYEIDGEGASNTDEDWAKREKAAKKLKKLNILITKLKKQKGTGRKTRRR